MLIHRRNKAKEDRISGQNRQLLLKNKMASSKYDNIPLQDDDDNDDDSDESNNHASLNGGEKASGGAMMKSSTTTLTSSSSITPKTHYPTPPPPIPTTMPIMPPPPPPPPNAMMMDPSSGNYHPDFMFCGACTTCAEPDSTKTELNEDERLETYEKVGLLANKKSNKANIILKTKFQLKQPISNPSHGLVIQSLLQPLRGVSKVVVNTSENCVIVNHDASSDTESILHALDSVGHSAFIPSHAPSSSSGGNGSDHSNDNPIWVRSQFYVEGICCASEIPAVKSIVKPLWGVSKLQINLTTKVVHVHHDISKITARHISQKLTTQGFPTTVQRDGEASAVAKRQASHHGRTTIRTVRGCLLTDDDIPTIQKLLSEIHGVSRIGINVSENAIYVDHDVKEVSSVQCLQKLRQASNHTCEIAIPAESSIGADRILAATATQFLDQIGRSKYVESTIQVEGLRDKQILKIVQNLMSQNYIRAQIRAVYPNVLSETIKVEHDPKLVSIIDVISDIQQQHGSSGSTIKATVIVDGGNTNLYLPLDEDYPNITQQPNSYGDDDEPSLLKIHCNIWLSGIFWILSLFSYNPDW